MNNLLKGALTLFIKLMIGCWILTCCTQASCAENSVITWNYLKSFGQITFRVVLSPSCDSLQVSNYRIVLSRGSIEYCVKNTWYKSQLAHGMPAIRKNQSLPDYKIVYLLPEEWSINNAAQFDSLATCYFSEDQESLFSDSKFANKASIKVSDLLLGMINRGLLKDEKGQSISSDSIDLSIVDNSKIYKDNLLGEALLSKGVFSATEEKPNNIYMILPRGKYNEFCNAFGSDVMEQLSINIMPDETPVVSKVDEVVRSKSVETPENANNTISKITKVTTTQDISNVNSPLIKVVINLKPCYYKSGNLQEMDGTMDLIWKDYLSSQAIVIKNGHPDTSTDLKKVESNKITIEIKEDDDLKIGLKGTEFTEVFTPVDITKQTDIQIVFKTDSVTINPHIASTFNIGRKIQEIELGYFLSQMDSICKLDFSLYDKVCKFRFPLMLTETGSFMVCLPSYYNRADNYHLVIESKSEGIDIEETVYSKSTQSININNIKNIAKIKLDIPKETREIIEEENIHYRGTRLKFNGVEIFQSINEGEVCILYTEVKKLGHYSIESIIYPDVIADSNNFIFQEEIKSVGPKNRWYFKHFVDLKLRKYKLKLDYQFVRNDNLHLDPTEIEISYKNGWPKTETFKMKEVYITAKYAADFSPIIKVRDLTDIWEVTNLNAWRNKLTSEGDKEKFTIQLSRILDILHLNVAYNVINGLSTGDSLEAIIVKPFIQSSDKSEICVLKDGKEFTIQSPKRFVNDDCIEFIVEQPLYYNLVISLKDRQGNVMDVSTGQDADADVKFEITSPLSSISIDLIAVSPKQVILIDRSDKTCVGSNLVINGIDDLIKQMKPLMPLVIVDNGFGPVLYSSARETYNDWIDKEAGQSGSIFGRSLDSLGYCYRNSSIFNRRSPVIYHFVFTNKSCVIFIKQSLTLFSKLYRQGIYRDFVHFYIPNLDLIHRDLIDPIYQQFKINPIDISDKLTFDSNQNPTLPTN